MKHSSDFKLTFLERKIKYLEMKLYMGRFSNKRPLVTENLCGAEGMIRTALFCTLSTALLPWTKIFKNKVEQYLRTSRIMVV